MKNKKKYTYLREIEIKYKHKRTSNKIIGNKAIDASTVVKLFSDLQNASKEKMIAVNLDSRNKIICFEIVAIGWVQAIYLRPMEIFRTSILVNAGGIILLHNHPSGDPKPSHDDKKLTQNIKILTDSMGLVFLDHIIVGLDSFYSFKNNDCFDIKV